MSIEAIDNGLSERLEDIIQLARSGRKISLKIDAYRKLVKQVSQSESTDDIPVETDMCMFMADFVPTSLLPNQPAKITKVYALSSINENEIDDKTIRHIANQRLDMDYSRLKNAGITFEAAYF
ncbi:hypothetical protein DESC_160027 [Desulfosarcina cetonica]|uniref:hypothetical protein n=1 Tax=Desulfosarcina cetonica TaxID=90730 RepID=UPI0006D22A3C|nr:hypothetical protein [Desulfosarcina cetonica]VTR64272.1 hypothetical protein DESC_160027 [Desulfosarcina cetonica]